MATKKQQRRRYNRRRAHNDPFGSHDKKLHHSHTEQHDEQHTQEERLIYCAQLADLTKPVLIQRADQLGVVVAKSWRKDHILSEITDAVMVGKVSI